ncbi:MAG: hypothetical protein JO257_25940 [Deltaproteobacteria bacterium]|nr:hypothetical protein [Deltaproteobacteria bacterium]
MLAGTAGARRLPFTFHALGGVGRLALTDQNVGALHVDRLELEVTDLGTDPGNAAAERFQRRRTRLRSLAVRLAPAALEERVEQVRRQLSGLGITNVHARLADGYVSVRARAADGLAAADVSMRIHAVHAGTHLRALASHIRVHGHLPTPGPVVADRVLAALLGATDAAGVAERPHARGLCDVEIDLIGALLWNLMPPAGWRLPAVAEIELSTVKITRSGIEVAYGPTGTRTAELGVRPAAQQLAAAHDLMHSADQQLRSGHIEDAMRGYRALLAAGGPEQPLLLERILALASARPAWFFDGLELARQALGRWPGFPAAHAALASIGLAQGDARDAASHLTQIAQQASGDGDDDQASLAALAGARLLRVLEPRSATQLYELALAHDPSSAEAADALVDRLTDEQRWPELVRLLRARAASAEPARAVQLRLRLADVFAQHLDDLPGAHAELAAARSLAPEDPAVHEMAATILQATDPAAAIEAWREVARLADARSDAKTGARAYAVLGDLIHDTQTSVGAEGAWRRALELDPLQETAIAGLASVAALHGDHKEAAELYVRLRGIGLPQQTAARHELALAQSLVALGRLDDARSSLRRATLVGGETAAEAHAVLAKIAEASEDKDHAAAELDTAISSLVGLAQETGKTGPGDERLYTRAAELAVERATLIDKTGGDATQDWERAHDLAHEHAPQIARDAALTMLSRAHDGAGERRWIDAVLATRPPPTERASLLIHRADVRRKEDKPDLAAAVADLHEALALLEDDNPEQAALRRKAYQLEADVLAKSGDQRARAQALAALARLAEREVERVEHETAAAAAWLAADEPAAALPHGARAHATLPPDVPAPLRRDVLTTLGEAAWRQRAWPDVIRAYKGLTDDKALDAGKVGTYRYRLAVAADRSGDAELAKSALRPLVDDGDSDAARATPPEVRGQALRLYADLAERVGDLAGAAAALEGFASVATQANASARADAMYRAGELFRRAERPDDAVRCLESALRISDTHLPALDALELAWRERGDLERVSVILGRKVAATARHPLRQKPLLSRLGDLQHQLGRPDVALATHQRALEIDATWRPSLQYVTTKLQDEGQLVTAAGGFAQLAGELAGDSGLDAALVARERHEAAKGLSDLVAGLDDAQLDAVRGVALPALERASLDPTSEVAKGLARLRGSPLRSEEAEHEDTQSGRMKGAAAGALSLRDAANRARASGNTHDTFAALEAANHVSPGDPDVLGELVELALQLGDHTAAARHLIALSNVASGSKRGDALIQLADLYYDELDDITRARQAMRDAADAFGQGMRRESTLRLLASEASSQLAWDVAVEALSGIVSARRTGGDWANLAMALVRAGKTGEALATIEEATRSGRFDDGGSLLAELRAEGERKAQLARSLEQKARTAPPAEARAMRAEAAALWDAIGGVYPESPSESGPMRVVKDDGPSVVIAATPEEASVAITSAAAAADRDRLLTAHRDQPDDPGILLALLAHLGEREPKLRREILDGVAAEGSGRAQAIALHELALVARSERDPIRAAALWTKAHRVDPSYTPVWMPLADALAAADELDMARELYEQIAASAGYDAQARAWATDRAAALGRDDSVVSGEIRGKPAAAPPSAALDQAKDLAEGDDLQGAIRKAEAAAEAAPEDPAPLALLEQLYFEAGDITATSEAIGRQLVIAHDATERANLWRRRAKLYRDALGRDAEAYRCLKEAHANAPADPEIAYQLRTAAMVRGEWGLVASLLYREIAGASNPRDRGALHLELALIYQEKLEDASQAQVNFEQALAFDPSIPAAKAPLAKHYEATGRYGDAARLYEEAANGARPAEKIALLAAAQRSRAQIKPDAGDLATKLERAEERGDLDAAVEIARGLWQSQAGHAAAFRTLAASARVSGDLAGLTELAATRAQHAGSAADRAAAWLEVARLADELDHPSEAARAYDRVLADDPHHAIALDARAQLAYHAFDFETAYRLYAVLPAADSALPLEELSLRRSIIAERLGKQSEALELARVAATASPARRDLQMRVRELAAHADELPVAIDAGKAVLDLVPLEDDEAMLAATFALVELYRAAGATGAAIPLLERIVRDHPHHANAIEQLADLHVARGDWPTATRYLYQLVPLATTPAERAERLFRLGEAILLHLNDVERADDVFLRASDIDPSHVPTLRRLLDVYWRADDPGALVDVAAELVRTGGIAMAAVAKSSLAQAVVAAALVGDAQLAQKLITALGDEAPARIAASLAELETRTGRFELTSASTAIAELGRRGMLDMTKIKAAASGTHLARILVQPV